MSPDLDNTLQMLLKSRKRWKVMEDEMLKKGG